MARRKKFKTTSVLSYSPHNPSFPPPCHCLVMRLSGRIRQEQQGNLRDNQPAINPAMTSKSPPRTKVTKYSAKKGLICSRKHRPEVRWLMCSSVTYQSYDVSRLSSDLNQARRRCCSASANLEQPYHLNSIRPTQNETDYMLTALTPLPLVNIIGPRFANLIIPGRLRVHSLWPGRPMPGSRRRESACMYIHLTSGNPMTSFSII